MEEELRRRHRSGHGSHGSGSKHGGRYGSGSKHGGRYGSGSIYDYQHGSGVEPR